MFYDEANYTYKGADKSCTVRKESNHVAENQRIWESSCW